MEDDPAEMNDLCGKEADVVLRLVKHWEIYFAETGMTETPQFRG